MMTFISFRGIRIFVARRKSSILLCIGLFFFFFLIHENTSGKSSNTKTTKYNLLEETKQSQHVKECTLEYANTHRLQQDHPCVLDLIRKRYLKKPWGPEIPLDLHNPQTADPSAGQAKAVMRILRNQKNGFFVECGASDGEFLSNTLYMERYKNWTGLLIEPDRGSYDSLLTRKRKATHVPACLSLETYPTEVSFKSVFQVGSIQEKSSWFGNDQLITVQCFPFYSFLLAYGRTSVDFFSLDIEGHELKVLKTIPWHKVDIKTIVVEWEHVDEGEEAIVKFMEESGFVNFGKIATPYARDIVFVKDFLSDLRYDYDD
ncbi:hypothetical protein OUZ56_006820 [Daphnia magna]|uniref:Methyltransferase FkbM domain-containing protein n=1 Tax=Daphnia magna TaxID=35525 RepID=A0ABQ9YY27_9CRUS|nr:hypothetical protein OUZ56_006820 [Daphnia magna]